MCGLAALICGSAARADLGIDAGASVAWMGNYVFRGARMAAAGFQSDIWASHDVNSRLSVMGYAWNYSVLNAGAGAKGSIETDVDLSVSYTPRWWENLFTVTAGWTYFDVQKGLGDDSGEVYGAVTANRFWWGLRPTVSVHYDYDDNGTIGGTDLRDVGTYVNLSVTRSWDLGDSGWRLDCLGAVGLDFGRGINTGREGLVRTALAYQLEKGLEFGPAIDWWIPSTQTDRGANNLRPVFSLGFTYNRSF